MSDCIFCKIVAGEVPSHKVWEDEHHLAFLTIFPNTEGFTVVVTKEHHESYFFDQSEDVMVNLVRAAKTVAKKIDAAYDDVGRTGFVAEGMGVNHLHVKLIPMHGTAGDWETRHSDINTYFSQYPGYLSTHNGEQADNEALAATAEKIRQA